MRVRVLYIETPNSYGGSMQSLLELIEYLPPKVETVVAAPYDPKQYRRVPDKVSLEIIQPPLTWGIHGYMRLLTQQLGWYLLVRRLLKKHQPDLVHVNSGPFRCVGGELAAKRMGLPVVEHARRFALRRYLPKVSVRCVDRYIAISRAVAKSLNDVGIPSEACDVVYDPIVPPSDAGVTRANNDVLPRIGILGILQPWKGQHIFIQSLYLLHRRSMSFHAFVAGSEAIGAKGYQQQLRRMAQEYGISTMVEFCGFVRNPYDMLRQWDVAVHASVEPEPLGRVVIEAMLIGTPVVATDGGGIPEFVEHERTGLLIPAGDVQAMADAMERLLRDVHLRRRLAEAGQLRAREMFDPRRHAEEVVQVYDHVASSKNKVTMNYM